MATPMRSEVAGPTDPRGGPHDTTPSAPRGGRAAPTEPGATRKRMDVPIGSAAGDACRPPTAGSARDAAPESLAGANARIEELERQLAGQARARAELVHLVSHELRTPITVIGGFCRLLRDEEQGPLAEGQRRFVDEIQRACRRLDAFVGDLLEAQPEGRTPFDVEPNEHDLHELVTAQLEALGPLLAERGTKVEASLRAEPSRLRFDARRIEQVVTNLMTNAIRYGRDAGVIRLSTESIVPSDEARRGGGPGAVAVIVEDDGPGIPEADRERLFAPYVRGPGCEAEQGLGIGLAICRRIVEAHGGRIQVASGALGGARFVFSLPRDGRGTGEG